MNNSKNNSLSDFDVNDNDDGNDIDMWNAASFDGDPEFDKGIFDRKPISFMGETVDDDEYNNRMLEEKRRKEEQQRAEENQLSESHEESNDDDPFEDDTYSVVNEDGYDINIDKNDDYDSTESDFNDPNDEHSERDTKENVESDEMIDEESEFNDDENQSDVHIEDNSDSEDSSYEGGRFKKFSLFGKKDNENTENVEKDSSSENENQFNNTNDGGFSIDFDTEDQHDNDTDVDTYISDYDESDTEETDESQYNGSDNEEPLVEQSNIQSNSDYIPYKDPNDELKIEDVPNEEESNVSEENDEHVGLTGEEETHDEENYSHDMNNYDSEEENFNENEKDHSSHEDSNEEISIEIVNKVIDAINEYNNSDDDVINKLHDKLDTNDMSIVIYNVINGYETFENDRGVDLLKDVLSKSSIERVFLILEYSDEDVHLLGDTVERVCGRSLNRDSDKIAYAKDIVYTIEETGITSEKL